MKTKRTAVLVSLLICGMMASAETVLYSQDFSSNADETFTNTGDWSGFTFAGSGNSYNMWVPGKTLTINENSNGTLEMFNADANNALLGVEALTLTGITGLNGVVTAGNLANIQLSFDYQSLTGNEVTLRVRLSNGGWGEAVFTDALTANNGMQTFSGTLDTLTDQGSFAGNINGANSWSVRFGSSADGTPQGEGYIIDNIQITQIPEPATMGLFGIFGGCIMFIRRRFAR